MDFHITNRVFIAKNIAVESVNGAEVTFILGKKPDVSGSGTDAIRGVRIEAGSVSGFTISNGFTYNSPTVSYDATRGGGIYCVSKNCIVTNCVITGNNAYDEGGGIFCNNGGNIIDCKIVGNKTGSGYGGGGGIACISNVNVSFCEILNNSAFIAGGVFCHAGGLVNNCFISDNIAELFGGGAYCYLSGTITDCEIVNNISSNFGGGFFARHGGAARRCRIIANNAKYGGGACLDTGGAMTNCLIINGNTAEFGGGVYIKNQGAVHSCTIGGNNANQKGGGIVCSNAVGEVANSIFYHNSAFIEGNNWYVEALSNLIFSYCCTTLANLLPGANGCISDNPEFINRTLNDYHLSGISPCRNAGFNLPWALAPGAIDLDHNPRIEEGTIDMGCYEFIPEPGFYLLFVIYQLLFINYWRKFETVNRKP